MIGPAGPARRPGRRRIALLEGTGGVCRRALVVAVTAMALAAGSLGHLAWACGANLRPQGPADQVFELRIESSEVAQDARTLRVTQGDDVRLRWTTDAPAVIHLHGYDIEAEVSPGRVTEFHLKAHATGRFPVEIHGHGDGPEQSHHETPLVVLEVYPR